MHSSSPPFRAVSVGVVLGLAGAIGGVIRFAEVRPLSVIEVRPANAGRDVPRGAQVSVLFSRPLDEETARTGLRLTPAAEGFVSVAGRRAVFTPRFGLRGDTAYTVSIGPKITDRGGRGLSREVVSRFLTAPLHLILRGVDGRLLRCPLGGGVEKVVAEARVGAFAVSADGRLAYVRPDEEALIIEPGAPGASRRIPLPAGLDVRELEWVPDGQALLLLGVNAADETGAGAPYLVHLAAAVASVEPFGPPPASIDPASALVTEALKKSLVEIVYRRESFALTPDARAAIIRDQNWDFAVIGLDGRRIASLGPFLAVGNTSPRGDILVVVDINPADPLLRRQVLAYPTQGSGIQTLSALELDSHSPRFAHQSDQVVFATALAVGPPGERHFVLEVMDLATGSRRPLTRPAKDESDEAPRWSPDDAWISFRRVTVGAPGRSTLWIVPVEGGPAAPLTVAATDARWIP